MDNREFYYQQNLEALAQAEDSYLDEVAEIHETILDRFLAGAALERALAAYQRAVEAITERLLPAMRFAQVMEAVAVLFNRGYNLSSNDDSNPQEDNRPLWVEIYGGFIRGYEPLDIEAVEGIEAAQTAVESYQLEGENPINWAELLEGWQPDRELLEIVYQVGDEATGYAHIRKVEPDEVAIWQSYQAED